jgi:hypothetical protein
MITGHVINVKLYKALVARLRCGVVWVPLDSGYIGSLDRRLESYARSQALPFRRRCHNKHAAELSHVIALE